MSRPSRSLIVTFTLALTLSACAGGIPPAPPTRAPTPPLPSPTPTCADIDALWGRDWAGVLRTLEHLLEHDVSCGAEPLASKKYAAHFNYAALLEAEGSLDAALNQYRAAYRLDPQRREARAALARLGALPTPTSPACSAALTPRPDPAPAQPPDISRFVDVQGDQLVVQGEILHVRGLNYYPRQTPWHSFLEETTPQAMAEEMDLIQRTGFNTIRVFLWYDALFTCQPEDAVPVESAFARVDTLLRLAEERDLWVVVTLNDLPDLTFRPLYTDWTRYDAQTTYIVRRYRNAPAILAWDLRNEGDLDYGARPGDEALFRQAEVLDWLAHVGRLVRANDPHHLVTAGWWGDPTATAPHVDLLSFHHWSGADQLRQRIERYRAQSDLPLLLEEVGYHSWDEASPGAQAEDEQAEQLHRAIEAAESMDIAGWIIWTAFDFEPPPGQPTNAEHLFGLWRTDLTPKPALEALPLHTD